MHMYSPFADALALGGELPDNAKGVAVLGRRQAAKLLAQYPGQHVVGTLHHVGGGGSGLGFLVQGCVRGHKVADKADSMRQEA